MNCETAGPYAYSLANIPRVRSVGHLCSAHSKQSVLELEHSWPHRCLETGAQYKAHPIISL